MMTMNGSVHKVARSIETVAEGTPEQIASLKERMATVQEQLCLLLDETARLGLKWNFNITEQGGHHRCAQMLIREF